MEWLCALALGVVMFAVVGHFLWLIGAAILRGIFGTSESPARESEPQRSFRYCPACGSDTEERDRYCPQCDLLLDSRLARDLNRVRIAEREVRALVDSDRLDRDAAGAVLDQLEARARSLQGLPKTKPGARWRAKPVAPGSPAPPPELPEPSEPAVPAGATELVPAPDTEAKSGSAEPAEPLVPAVAALSAPAAPTELEPRASAPFVPAEPPPPKRKLSSFLEEHNILWGEIVGGLLIVGCSIALLVTLWRQLEEERYFPFGLSFLVTGALFGAGWYTLHQWKLKGTSRGMLVISMMLAPLTLLLLSDPVAHGTGSPLDIGIKLAAVAAFVGIVRTGGRDLIGTEHLPGPIDRRWLLVLAVVGPAGTQLLPAPMSSAWVPLVCFVVACGATLGGLSWYHPGRREELISNKSGTALLMFVGLAVFALFAAWGLYLVRPPVLVIDRLHLLAVPLALAAVPVVEAGVLVMRRVTSIGLRTTGTAVALLGFLGLTTALALAWPGPLPLFLVSAAAGAFLTRVAFRERLVWVQIGAIPLVAFAAVVGFHGIAGSWSAPEELLALHLGALFDSSATGAVLVGFALVAGVLVAELLARRPSPQAFGYALGALVVGVIGLALVSAHGANNPYPAALAHAAAALGLLATNVRWKRLALAHGGLWLALGATLWALWALGPRRPDLWGFVVAVEALVLAAGAVGLRGTSGAALALLRRAAGDVAFGVCALAIVLSVSSGTLRSDWHTGTLFALALSGLALARLTTWPALTWAGSLTALLGFVHFALQANDGKFDPLAIETAIMTHVTCATLAALACRQQASVFGDPFRFSARLSSVFAVPLLFWVPFGLAYVSALLAVWLGAVWLAFVLLWKERGAFSAFQAAITLAGLLLAFGWIEQQSWWATTGLRHRDPRALHAFGIALAALALVWTGARRALQPLPRAREIWCGNPLSLDRFVLGATVIGFLMLAVVAVAPVARAELTALHRLPPAAPAELVHAFAPSAWGLFALLAGAVVLSWRLSPFEQDTGPHVAGLALLLLAAPLVWAGTFAGEFAAASALRWGLALAFVVGSGAIALREPLQRGLEASGFVVRPAPWIHPGMLALFAVAAGAVLVISMQVAELGLNRIAPHGPSEVSIFALMGALPSNLVPLALVVFGLAATAGRERSSGYALSGGLVFVLTLTAGYALALVTAGQALGAPERTRLFLVAASSAAVWALAWLASERRVPGGIPLVIQVCLGFGALGTISFATAAGFYFWPNATAELQVDGFGRFGWLALALVAGAGFWHTQRAHSEAFWHTRRDPREALPLVFGFVALVVGVLIASSLREIDSPGLWLAFHAMTIVWAAGGFALFAGLRPSRTADAVLTAFAGLLVMCALRGAWYTHPLHPWWPVGLALSAAVFLGAVALRRQLGGLALASALVVDLAALLIWLAYGPMTLAGFVLANAAGAGAATAIWALVRIRQSAAAPNWLAWLVPAPVVAFGLLAFGLLPVLTGESAAPTRLAWGATAAVALSCAVGLWDRAGRFALAGLYMTAVLAVLFAVVKTDQPVWDAPAVSAVLGAFVLAASGAALALSRRTTPLLGMPDRGDSWLGFLSAQALVAAFAILVGIRIGLFAPSIWERLASPLGVVLFAGTFAVLTRTLPDAFRAGLRTLTAALAVGALGALAWAVPDPADRFAWLHRNAWLFVALTAAALVGSEIAARVGANWRVAIRSVTGWAAALAFAVLCVNLLQQVPAFDPVAKRTPLASAEALVMLAAIGALVVLALRFALKEDRDPFALPAAFRTTYVYLAEVLLVLFFTQIRLNLPELFPPELAALWTFTVMILAYVGIGLAELFERKKLDVLAVPLRRTGVLLPLVPLLAFWLKPPAFLSEFARDAAPGLGPLLGYLEKLPQHFGLYAWLWVLAGGLYGVVALLRKSFGWALLAALATNAALWALLTHHEVPFAVHPQAWVIPLALIVLVSEHLNRRRLSAEASNALRYAGITMIYVASAADMFIAGVGSSLWLPVVLAVLCVAGVFAGIVLRVRAFIYLGVAFLFLDVFSMIWHAAVNLQHTWVWYVSGIVLGVLVLGVFAYLEKRRTHAERGAE
jgi:hypothetical protein